MMGLPSMRTKRRYEAECKFPRGNQRHIYIYILSFFKQSVMKGRSQVGVYYIIYFIIQQWA